VSPETTRFYDRARTAYREHPTYRLALCAPTRIGCLKACCCQADETPLALSTQEIVVRKSAIVAVLIGSVVAFGASPATAAPDKAKCVAKAKKKTGKAKNPALAKCRKAAAKPAPAAPVVPPAPPAAPVAELRVESTDIVNGMVVMSWVNVPAAPLGSHYKATFVSFNVDGALANSCTYLMSKDWVNPVVGREMLSAYMDGGRSLKPLCTGPAAVSLSIVPDAAPPTYTGTTAYKAEFTVG